MRRCIQPAQVWRRVTRPLSTSSRGTVDYFEILKVDVHASPAAIKAKFYEQAKLLHPDLNRNPKDAQEAKLQFVRLTQAYETLIDPRLRAEYLRRGRRHVVSGGDTVETARDRWNASMKRRRNRPTSWMSESEGAHEHGEEEGSRRAEEAAARRALSFLEAELTAPIREEFEAAVTHAYLGPKVEEDELPWALEAEERRPQEREEDLHEHIVELTSGQQLLGYVRACNPNVDLLSHPPDSPETDSRHQQQDDQPPSVSSAAAEHPQSHMPPPVVHGSRNLIGVDGPEYAPLELVWQGKPLAQAWRAYDLTHEEDVVVVHALPGALTEPYTLRTITDDGSAFLALVSNLAATGPLTKHTVEDKTGVKTHTIVCHSTPGVKHMHWLRHPDGAVESRVMRGWLPPSHLWYFPPRSETHDIGGWYIERCAGKKEQETLHLAVCILVCAYRTLDREKRAREAGRRSWKDAVSQSAKSFVSSLFKQHGQSPQVEGTGGGPGSTHPWRQGDGGPRKQYAHGSRNHIKFIASCHIRGRNFG